VGQFGRLERIPSNSETSALVELFRVLKYNTSLLLSTPNHHLISKLLDLAYFLRGHRHYNVNKIGRIMESCGFVIVEKHVKGRIFSLISMDMVYLYKHNHFSNGSVNLSTTSCQKHYKPYPVSSHILIQ
jgi:hypothetical protein